MTTAFCRRLLSASFGIILLGFATRQIPAQTTPSDGNKEAAGAGVQWTSAARWKHGLKKTSGTLSLTETGVEFRPTSGPSLSWPYEEIQTFDLSPRQLRLTGYENRQWHFHGERSFSFNLESPVPPDVAAELTRRVGKPAANGIPDPSAPAFTVLDARHRTRGGGTNGTLRFRNSGIDYVTTSGQGARTWRWADIQTLARPDAYHFRVGGYHETFEFELKQPMSQELFDRLWNDVYAQDLTGVNLNGGSRQ
jgi:hypothetical protein